MDASSVFDFDSPVRSVAVAVLLAVAGLGIGLLLVLGAGLSFALAGVTPGPTLQVVVSLIAIQGVGLLGVSAAYLLYRDTDLVGMRVPTIRDAIWAGSGFAIVIVGYFVIAQVVAALDVTPAENQIAQLAEGNPDLLLLLIPAAFLIIGPGEEYLFRGIVQGRLREVFSAPVAIAIASVIFGAAHLASISGPLTGSLVYVGIVALLAVVLGVSYEATDNVLVPSFIHGAYNAVLFGLLWVALKFFPEALQEAQDAQNAALWRLGETVTTVVPAVT